MALRVVSLVACLLVLISPLVAQDFGAPEGKTYEVTMTRIMPNGNEVNFCTCMRFSENAPGFLTMDHYAWKLRWVHRSNDLESPFWESTIGVNGNNRAARGVQTPAEGASAHGFFALAHHGEVIWVPDPENGDTTMIRGNGVAEFGGAFDFEGFENPSCSLQTCVVIAD